MSAACRSVWVCSRCVDHFSAGRYCLIRVGSAYLRQLADHGLLERLQLRGPLLGRLVLGLVC